jgi:hypothetical protein
LLIEKTLCVYGRERQGGARRGKAGLAHGKRTVCARVPVSVRTVIEFLCLLSFTSPEPSYLGDFPSHKVLLCAGKFHVNGVVAMVLPVMNHQPELGNPVDPSAINQTPDEGTFVSSVV